MLIDLLPDFIFVKDARHRFLIANKAIAKAYGCTPAELISRTDADFLSAEMAVRCRAPEQQVLAGKSIAIEDTISFPDGKTRTMVTNMAPFRDANGAVCGLAGIGRDITKRKGAEENLRQSEERYHILFKTLIEGFCTIEVIFDANGKPVDYHFLEVNPAFEKQTGIRNAEGRSVRELVPKIEPHWFEAYGKIALTGEPAHFESEAKALGRYFDVYAYRVGGPESRKVAVLFNDITARKGSEQLLQRANRTLEAIRDCHEAMLRADTESELLEQVCSIIVQTGGELMAWVGFAERNAQKTVRPVAAAGFRKNYLSSARITWADTARGRGPMGTAIRTGKVSLCQNTLTDPNFAPWRKEARQHGYGSAIALPLMADKQCFGALGIYAPETNAFDIGEQLQLTSLANDLALGIYMLRLRADRERLEHEILHSIEREQKRIGRDLHDGLCQLLVGAKLRSVYMESMAKGRYPALVEEAQALEETLSQAIDQARDLARGLNPVKVTPAGLPAALLKLADDVDQVRGPHCMCRIPERVKISNPDIAYHLYHIAQEALQNALKHARSENISISLEGRDGHISLIVEDDGVGIQKNRKPTGMGLRNMQARARLIGGRLEIRARKRSGTIVVCELFEKQQKS
jgi:PAS domain S-box-containing protein